LVDEAKVLIEKDAKRHIARITLNNPARRNAIQPEMRTLIAEYLQDVAEDDDIKVLILRGAGGTFTTGADLKYAYDWYKKEGDERRPSQRRRLSVDRANQAWYHKLIGYPKATVVQCESYALGAGLEMTLASDISILGESTKIGMPATRFLGPVLGNLPLFFYRLGPVLTKELLLTGTTKLAGELADRGVFTRIVPDAEVPETVETIAAQIAKMPADGVHLAKEAYRLVEMNQGLAMEEVLSYMLHTFGTNIRFEPDEFNFVRERSKGGTTEAFASRDEYYGDPVAG
jgi:enoyl-CoA hydratase